VDAAFQRERTDRRARRAVRRDLWSVAHHVVADGQCVREVVHRHAADAALLHWRPGERPSLVFEDALRCNDLTVPLGAELDVDNGAGGRASGTEYLLAAHHELD